MPFKILMTTAALCFLLTAGCAAKKQVVETPAPEAKAKAKVMEMRPVAPVGHKAEKAEAPPKKKEEGPVTQKPLKPKEVEAFNDWITVLNKELEEPAPTPIPHAEKVIKGEAAGQQTVKKDSLESAVPVKESEVVNLKSLKLKVLSGDGKLASAKAMSRRLAKMGYKISGVDLASKSSFEGTTIFFAKSYEDAAKQMAERLGGKTVRKPLTWKSVYHLIVVTGK